MDPRTMKDPAAGVPAQLLQHLHLVSKHRYPLLANPSLETIVSYLIEAPKIMRDMAPVHWQYLDAPQDGALFLTWQPLEYLNTNFASDGYVWADAEQPFNSEVRGYTLQMFWHRAGYKPQVEAVAAHSRRRYRLIPNNQMGMATPDPSLWLIHYSKAQARDQHPVASLPMLPHITQQFQQRALIQRSGQIPRKDFMLHDRANWPIISTPPGVARAGASAQVAAGHRRGQSLVHETTVEEEEDVSRGDALDFMTPRDVSRMRYEQHHEWMEEILESPYATRNIIPSELGLGRKGTLEVFTTGFFTAPTSTAQDAPNGTIGHMTVGKAEEFTKHANQKLAEMQADLEQMKQRHIRRMEKLRRTTELGAAERKLRNTNVNGSDDTFKVVASQVQDLIGRKIEPVSRVACVSKGGLQDIRPIVPVARDIPAQNQTEIQQTGAKQGTNPHQQAQAHAQAQVQQQQQQQPSPQSQPQQSQQPLPPSQPPKTESEQKDANNVSETATQDASVSEPMPENSNEAPKDIQIAKVDDMNTADLTSKTEPEQVNVSTPMDNDDPLDNNDDINMDGLDDQDMMTGDDNIDTADWDIVNDQEEGNEMDGTSNRGVNEEQTDPTQSRHESVLGQEEVQQTAQSSHNTPMGETNDFDMVEDFDANMDTAGDALADYNADEDLNLDDSAFGDAFHHNEQDMS